MDDQSGSINPVFMIAYCLTILVAYVYVSLTLVTLAKKTNTDNAWMGWVPIANLVLMAQIAGKPGWWAVLLLIPVVNWVIYVMVWMKISEARMRPAWLGILTLVPLVNLVVMGYLAFADAPGAPSTQRNF